MNGKIDQTDCRIIELLQTDGRMPNTMIAKKLGISEATVRSRLNRLIKEEYVQIVAVSDPLKLGFGVCGIMKIDVDIKKIDTVSRELSKIEQLWYIVHATGSAYIYAEFNAKSIDDLNDVISNRINKIDGLLKTETNLVLKFIKRRYDWKTAME
ncbi:MAG: Lrp/AsnC family transcriptional regulator [Deltaproteobacteria bacterium]|jgi:Lrp/AsnC family transcriptional regulator for asnA, asnC and gidA